MPKRKGFTLIELMVVMAIIALLAMIGGAAYISAQKRGRNARRAADIQQIRSALEMARTDKGMYPAAVLCDTSAGYSTTDATCATMTGSSWYSIAGTGGFALTLTNGYMSTVPKDVMNNTNYYFRYVPFKSDGVTACDNTAGNLCLRYELRYSEEPVTGAGPISVVVKSP